MTEQNQTQEAQQLIDPSSTTVQDMFAHVLKARLQSGAMERAIDKRVDELIAKTADEVFSSWSDVGKALKDVMTKSIMPQIEKLDDLPVYHEFVMNRIKLAAQNFYDNRLTEVVDKELSEVFTELPEQTTLSWLVDKVIESAKEDEDEHSEKITLIIEDKSGEWNWSKPGDSVMLYLDKGEDESARECDFVLHLSKHKESGKYDILGVRVRGRKPGEALTIGRIYNLEKVLFNLYAMKGRIDLDKGLDADDYDTSFERERDCHC